MAARRSRSEMKPSAHADPSVASDQKITPAAMILRRSKWSAAQPKGIVVTAKTKKKPDDSMPSWKSVSANASRRGSYMATITMRST
jgi:hypothetical protein